MKLIAIITALLLATSSNASAQPEEEKSENLALGLSVVGSLGGSALLVYGSESRGLFSNLSNEERERRERALLAGFAVSAFAPSMGHWYAGEPLTGGMVVRVLGVGGIIGGYATWNGYVLLGGIGCLISGTIWDLATVRGAVRERNASTMTVVPTAQRSGGGVSLVGTF